MQQSTSLHSGQLSKYSAGPLSENLSSLQQITIGTRKEGTLSDPLGVAERGKVGLPPSSSECSSSSSQDASIESNMGILNGEKKGNHHDPKHNNFIIISQCNVFYLVNRSPINYAQFTVI